MPTPTGIDIPPDLLRRLRFRAKREHRSLEDEILHCLGAGLIQQDTPERFLDRARRLRQLAHGVLRVNELESLIEHGRS
ncbi:FitA-like ribbon-helix-helix domain-containing protein [Cerasicoccus maritimus]|uniref:FitA-like ribbon-helix-helix domain-containing protein n=1 Tax=Cerasicoccus maritimus TaxID=490089 RepID=UPI002852821F|nr:hypothetical protein [Cerasicoccus maritimus]